MIGSAHTWFCALRSLHGHIRTLSPKGLPYLSLGAGVLANRRETEEDMYTLALGRGIEEIQAKYPWVDTVDLHLFLMGFDAATRFQTRTMGTQVDART